MSKKNTEKKEKKPEIEIKLIKHILTLEERDEIGGELAAAHSKLCEINGEFDQVKASYKAKVTEQESKIGRISSLRNAGYEMRNARCRVEYFPKEARKKYWLEFADAKADPVLIEDMSAADVQAKLIPDAPALDATHELILWDSEADGKCLMIIGRMKQEAPKKDQWFAALDLRIGGESLCEELMNGQPTATVRQDIIARAAKRCKTWLVKAVGKEAAQGFHAQIDAAVESQKERVE